MNKHCCSMMDNFLEDKRIPLKYYPKYREYNIDLYNSSAMQGIVFCPWCSAKLPESLREDYYNILENEYDIIDDFNKNKSLPEEFKTDEWWKKRKL